MIKLDITILDEVGLGDLPEDEKKKLFETFVETLELNVGTVLSAQMKEEQLAEFMKLADQNEQGKARDWLENNAPNYKAVVADELDKLKNDMKNNASAIRTSIEDESKE
jgi:carboxylesterase type B